MSDTVTSSLRHREIDANGTTFHLTEAGSGEPVLLLAAFPLHAHTWRAIIPLLAEGYHVIAFDPRGTGRSAAPVSGYDTSTLVSDLLAVLDALGLPRVRLIAHGFGAGVGFRLCADHPERVSAFVALNMTPPWPGSASLPRNAWRFWHTALWEYPLLGPLVLRRLPGVTRYLLRHWSTTPWTDADLAAFVDVTREPAHARAGQQHYWQFVLHDIPRLRRLRRDPGPRFTVPTLLLGGASDPVVPPHLLRGLEYHADSLTVRILPGGHLLPEDAPEEIAAAARALFAAGVGQS
ncbi:pimeloyl-ACP methyl ester carboxylesterase [Streptacidiphilus sp. MAP12-33]|uniref:alpha/beta fold hydrolase n=1 Tax=Streptacidiphilus sp. MAP12-33 TaxID=3156266 RepID=UPI0035182905